MILSREFGKAVFVSGKQAAVKRTARGLPRQETSETRLTVAFLFAMTTPRTNYWYNEQDVINALATAGDARTRRWLPAWQAQDVGGMAFDYMPDEATQGAKATDLPLMVPYAW